MDQAFRLLNPRKGTETSGIWSPELVAIILSAYLIPARGLKRYTERVGKEKRFLSAYLIPARGLKLFQFFRLNSLIDFPLT